MIRPARDDDYAAFASLFPELQIDDPIPSRERWCDDLRRETLVADVGGNIHGYISFYKLAAAGYVRNLVVAPAARGTGVGGELMRTAAAQLKHAGVPEWHLNVKVDNAPAIRLYEKLGMAVEHRTTVLGLDWSALDRLPHDDATVLPVDPAEDDDIERALHLIGGRLAMTRRRASRRLIQLRDSSCAPVGIAVFDPELGASPFRVARPGLAAPLLAACRPYATKPTLQVVIEDDAALADLLVAAGATVKLRLLHYLGVL
jgi:GNAT superfamily N-acetyltransferase